MSRSSKVLAAGKNAAKQDCGIDRRDFRVPHSFPGIDVGKVIEESAMRRQCSPKKRERRQHAQASVLVGDEAALLRDADRSQAKAGGGDAGHDPRVRRARVAAVFNQARLRTGLLPEEEEIAAFKIVQELLILRRKGVWGAAGPYAACRPWACVCASAARSVHGASGRPMETPAICRSSWRRDLTMLARVDHCANVCRLRQFHPRLQLAHLRIAGDKEID